MRKRAFLAVLVLLAVILACGQQLPDWERHHSGEITPPVTDDTKYLCVTEENGISVVINNVPEIVPKETKLIDSGRRWAMVNSYAIAYYKGYVITVGLDSVKEC